MSEQKSQSIDLALESRHLSILQRTLLTPVAYDFAAVFSDQFGAVEYDVIADKTKAFELMAIPGQAFARKFTKAFELRDDPEIKATYEGKIDRNDWRLLLGLGGVGLMMGLAAEISEGGGGNEYLPPSVVLYPNLVVNGAMAVFAPEALLPTLSLLTILKIVTVPYTEFHEIAHALSAKNFKDRFGSRLSETWTDFWAKVVSNYGKDRNLVSRLANDFTRNPITAYMGGPFQSFDRTLVESFVINITKLSRIPRESVLAAMAQLYCGKSEELLDMVYDLSRGRENDVFNLFNERSPQNKKVTHMEKLLRAK